MATDKERMLQGEPFYSYDPALKRARRRAQRLLWVRNMLPPSDTVTRFVAKKLFGSVGNNLDLRGGFTCEYGSNIFIEEDVYIGYGCYFQDAGQIRIGDRAMIGSNVRIGTSSHSEDPVERQKPGNDRAQTVVIGSDAVIYGSAVIFPGVSIGKESIVGHGSLVTKDVPSGVVVFGSPARIIRPIRRGSAGN